MCNLNPSQLQYVDGRHICWNAEYISHPLSFNTIALHLRWPLDQAQQPLTLAIEYVCDISSIHLPQKVTDQKYFKKNCSPSNLQVDINFTTKTTISIKSRDPKDPLVEIYQVHGIPVIQHTSQISSHTSTSRLHLPTLQRL